MLLVSKRPSVKGTSLQLCKLLIVQWRLNYLIQGCCLSHFTWIQAQPNPLAQYFVILMSLLEEDSWLWLVPCRASGPASPQGSTFQSSKMTGDLPIIHSQELEETWTPFWQLQTQINLLLATVHYTSFEVIVMEMSFWLSGPTLLQWAPAVTLNVHKWVIAIKQLLTEVTFGWW